MRAGADLLETLTFSDLHFNFPKINFLLNFRTTFTYKNELGLSIMQKTDTITKFFANSNDQILSYYNSLFAHDLTLHSI